MLIRVTQIVSLVPYKTRVIGVNADNIDLATPEQHADTGHVFTWLQGKGFNMRVEETLLAIQQLEQEAVSL